MNVNVKQLGVTCCVYNVLMCAYRFVFCLSVCLSVIDFTVAEKIVHLQ